MLLFKDVLSKSTNKRAFQRARGKEEPLSFTYLLLVGETPSPPVEALRSHQDLLVGGQWIRGARVLSSGALYLSACVTAEKGKKGASRKKNDPICHWLEQEFLERSDKMIPFLEKPIIIFD